MRKFKVIIEYFETEDDATDAEIAEEAKDIFLNSCNYGFHEVTDGEDDE